MLAAQVGFPWRSAIILAGAIAGAIGVTSGPGVPTTGGPPTYVHVKLAAEGVTPSALDPTRSHALFTSLAPGTHDDRARWIRVSAPSAADAQVLARQLAADPTVEQAFVEPVVTLPTTQRPAGDGDSCPITTPSFESYQGYLGPAPHGIDAPAAWRRGLRGGGIWFADIEGGWNAAHEDLPGDRIRHVVGKPIRDPSWRAHGTAVLGEVVGRDNGKGVVGIAPDVERVFTASIDGVSVADAIDTAARELRPGDVLLIELQGGGPRGRYIPMEYWDDIYDTIRAHTRRGVIVIEAAGNGDEDLDHAAYDRKFDRKKRDSGAIMIGAGGPPRAGFRDRERLDFSNYGGRVDVQGWGRKVATLDYGDLQACDGEDRTYADRHYTGEFSGTSSASPIVAGAAVLLEGFARQRGRVLAPAELRELLRRTGTPQAGDTRKAIGPRPDLARALSALE
jgi:subtilisin family serine protease